MEFKVMTYNIHHGIGMDGKNSLKQIKELIEESGADVVGINEADRSFSGRSRFIDQISWLSEKLSMHAAFGATMTRKREDAAVGQFGNALLSRFPILSHGNHLLRAGRSLVSESRGLLETEIQLDKTPKGSAKIFVTHLSLMPLRRRIQASWIARKISDETLPVILMGDMNMRPGSRSWSQFSTVLNDVNKNIGDRLHTFPSFRPRFQLDYMFVGASIEVRSAEVVQTHRYASDHLPLKATLRLKVDQK